MSALMLPQGVTQAQIDAAMLGICDVFVGAFNDMLQLGHDALMASIEAQAVLWRVGLATSIALKSGAEHELEFYGGAR